MRLDSGILSLAPSDLSRHLGCAHATTLALEAARGERPKPHAGSAYERMIQEKGDAHERAYLAELEARGLEIVTIERAGSYADMAARTRAAMQAGAPVVYQATFELGRWRGHADFLERVEKETAWARSATRRWTPSSRATRRARRTSCSCASTARASRPCRVTRRSTCTSRSAPAGASRFGHATSTRTSRARNARSSASSTRRPQPSPRSASPVRGARSGPLATSSGVPPTTFTMSPRSGARRPPCSRPRECRRWRRWPRAPCSPRPVDLKTGTLATLHEQARLQEATRSNGHVATELLPAEDGRGFERLPEPSRLDLAIDLEGDPFWRADRELDFHVRAARP